MEKFTVNMNSEIRQNRMDIVLENKQPNLELFFDNIHDSHNLSAIIRSCDAVGVMSLYYSNPNNNNFKLHKTITQGAHRWVNNHKIHNDEKIEFLKQKQKEGFQIVATHVDKNCISYREIDYTLPTIIIAGNEKEGVTDEVLAIADKTIFIPMKGMVQSLNVSVAASLILYEAQEQLEEVGKYNHPQLAEEERKEIKEKWIYRDTIARKSKGKIKMPPE